MSIFVGNLPFRAEREDVLQLFAPFGEVLNCSLPLERDTGRKRGFAFVEMADEAIESTAIDGLQGTELMGRPLRINKAEPRGSGGSRRGGSNHGIAGHCFRIHSFPDKPRLHFTRTRERLQWTNRPQGPMGRVGGLR